MVCWFRLLVGVIWMFRRTTQTGSTEFPLTMVPEQMQPIIGSQCIRSVLQHVWRNIWERRRWRVDGTPQPIDYKVALIKYIGLRNAACMRTPMLDGHFLSRRNV